AFAQVAERVCAAWQVPLELSGQAKVPQPSKLTHRWVMPNFIQKRFTNPETFRRIRPDLLLAWLKRSESYLAKQGLILPADCSGFERNAFKPGFDFEKLVRVFMEPSPDMPAELVDSMHMIHEMGTTKRYDKMVAELDRNGLRSKLANGATPLDVALLL